MRIAGDTQFRRGRRSSCRGPRSEGRYDRRGAELAHLQALLPGERETDSGCRLVTFTGPGGSGKTRLAIEGGRRLRASFGDAIWFVPLADLPQAIRPLTNPRLHVELSRSPREEPRLFEALGRGGGDRRTAGTWAFVSSPQRRFETRSHRLPPGRPGSRGSGWGSDRNRCRHVVSYLV
jgi:hypothetical protein